MERWRDERDEERGIGEKANMRDAERESGLQEKGTELKRSSGGRNQSRVEESRRGGTVVLCFPKILWVGFYDDPATSTGRSGNLMPLQVDMSI
jgi:hypothetical protein